MIVVLCEHCSAVSELPLKIVSACQQFDSVELTKYAFPPSSVSNVTTNFVSNFHIEPSTQELTRGAVWNIKRISSSTYKLLPILI